MNFEEEYLRYAQRKQQAAMSGFGLYTPSSATSPKVLSPTQEPEVNKKLLLLEEEDL